MSPTSSGALKGKAKQYAQMSEHKPPIDKKSGTLTYFPQTLMANTVNPHHHSSANRNSILQH